VSSPTHPLIGSHNTQNTSNQSTSTPFHCPKTGTSSPQYHHKDPKSEISTMLQNSSGHLGTIERRTYNLNTIDSLKTFFN